MTSKIVCIGDALIDTFLSIHDAARYCRIDHEHMEICFEAGAKIMVDDAQFQLGGNACNVSVGLSRLGFSTVLAAELGTDEFSEKIIKGLQKDNVSLDLVKQTPDAPSTFSVCLNFKKERTLFVRHVTRKHELDLEKITPDWIYLTSLGKEWEELYKKSSEYMQKTGAKVAFNPGSTQLLAGREHFKDILQITNILLINKEEAEEILYGVVQHTQNEANKPSTMVKELQKLGPKIVCITDGTNGSDTIDENGELYHEGIVQAECIEKTGAGDAYSSGFIAAIINGESVPTAMKWGAVNSANVITKYGAQPGLLTKEEIVRRIGSL